MVFAPSVPSSLHKNVIQGMLAPFAAVSFVAAVAGPALAEDDSAALAQQLANPIASLISVPFQGNYNGRIGPANDGEQYFVNLQPVIPFSLSPDWNLISRTILPIISQGDIFPGAGSQFGLGNTTQSFFFSPNKVVNGFIWGAGPVVYLPTATDDLLGPDKWGAGPTAVGLWQGDGWTIGMLANHIWSFAGDNNVADVNATFLQPFISYTTKDAWTFTLDTESTYNWETDQWSLPFNGVVAKLVHFGKRPVSLFAGVRYWALSPEDSGRKGGTRAPA
jgi:hypothetical protein